MFTRKHSKTDCKSLSEYRLIPFRRAGRPLVCQSLHQLSDTNITSSRYLLFISKSFDFLCGVFDINSDNFYDLTKKLILFMWRKEKVLLKRHKNRLNVQIFYSWLQVSLIFIFNLSLKIVTKINSQLICF